MIHQIIIYLFTISFLSAIVFIAIQIHKIKKLLENQTREDQ